MSGLLKAGDARALAIVASLENGPQSDAGRVLPPALPTPQPREERPGLDAIVADLRDRLRQAAEEADMREEAAYARGARDGREAASAEQADKAELLAAAIGKAEQTLANRLEECDLLSLQVARAALLRILGSESWRSELVEETLRHHMGLVKRELVVAIRLSPADFGEPEKLDEIQGLYPAISIRCDDNLQSGECLVDLRLGRLDLGLAGQGRRLAELIERLEEEERPA